MKLIIVNRTTHSMSSVLRLAAQVIDKGRVSDDGKSYSYGTRFLGGTMCSAKRNKESDTLIFWEEG